MSFENVGDKIREEKGIIRFPRIRFSYHRADFKECHNF